VPMPQELVRDWLEQSELINRLTPDQEKEACDMLAPYVLELVEQTQEQSSA
jgi:hypothetical protein